MTLRPISVIVLAAGTGSRMDSAKPLSKLKGKPLLQYSLDLVSELPVAERLLVVGHQAHSLYPLICGYPIWVLFHADYLQGIGTSISWGIHQASNSVKGYLIWLADMPLLSASVVTDMMDAFLAEDDQSWIMRPEYQHKPGHPVLFSRKLKPWLRELTGDTGARFIIANQKDHVVNFPWPDSSCILDVDTPHDLKRLNNS